MLRAGLPLAHARGRQRPNPSALLGPCHRLVRALDALTVLIRQTLAVLAALAACAVAYAAEAAWARPAALGAAAVLVVVAGIGAALLRQARRSALDLIVEGRERLPLAAVEWERRRLLKPRTRARLATELEDVLTDTLLPRGAPVASRSLLADDRVLRAIASELCAVAALVRGTPASAGGIALVERLLIDRGSALYGSEVRPLREELRRARYLLQWRAGTTDR